MSNLQTKIELEVLKTKMHIAQAMIDDEVWKTSESPHMHDHYVKEFFSDTETYVEMLRPLLIPNKTYVMNMSNFIRTSSEGSDIVPFLFDNMVYGEYKNQHDDYLYDSSKPFQIHRYSDYGGETMEDNKSEIIECLYVSEWTFFVDNDGNTIINGRPDDTDNTKINVKVNKNIFDTNLILNISLVTQFK